MAAFLLNVVLSRIINLQREQIAALKAFGYSRWEVGLHYLKLVLLIVAMGLCIGIPCGMWFGRVVTGMYAKLFHFPTFTYRLTYDVALTASLVSVVAATLGAWGSIMRAVRLPPVVNMILRQLERHMLKTSMSILAISLAVVGNFMEDPVEYILNAQFRTVQKFDMSLATIEPVSDRAIYEVASMPGVVYCEPTRSVSTRIRAGSHHRRVGIKGLPGDSRLFGLIDIDGQRIDIPKFDFRTHAASAIRYSSGLRNL